MKIEDIKVGMKVKIPTNKSLGLDYRIFEHQLLNEGKNVMYAVVYAIRDKTQVELEFKNDFAGYFYYDFSPKDLTPYEEVEAIKSGLIAAETPKEQPEVAYVLGSTVEAHDSIVQEQAIEVEGVRTFQDGVETTDDQEYEDNEVSFANPPKGIQVMTVDSFLDQQIGPVPTDKINDYSPGSDFDFDKVRAKGDPIKGDITNDSFHNELPKQGLRYNEGKLDYTLMDMSAFKPMIEVLEYGAHKYSVFQDEFGKQYKGSEVNQSAVKLYGWKTISSGRDNWKLGGPQMTVTKLFASLFRHIASFLGGEDLDKESGLSHIGHCMCNIMFLGYHMQQHLKNKKAKKGTIFDDRFKSK